MESSDDNEIPGPSEKQYSSSNPAAVKSAPEHAGAVAGVYTNKVFFFFHHC